MSEHGPSAQQSTYSNYPPPGYGWFPPPAQRTSTQSIVVLVLGIASLTVFWGIAGIVALFLAPGAKREIAASNNTLGGAGLIRAGVICSWISIVLTVLAIALVVALLIVVGTGGGGVDTSITTGIVSLGAAVN